MHVEVGRQGHLTRLPGRGYARLPPDAGCLEWLGVRLVTYSLMAFAYVVGAALAGMGFFLTRQGAFPGWWRPWMMWPLVRQTPHVIHLMGWAGIALGASILAIGFTPLVPELLGGVLVLAAMVAYLAGVVLFAYSTYLSRRPTS